MIKELMILILDFLRNWCVVNCFFIIDLILVKKCPGFKVVLMDFKNIFNLLKGV